MPIKFLLLGGGGGALGFFRRVGGSANFIFMGVGIFPIKAESSTSNLTRNHSLGHRSSKPGYSDEIVYVLWAPNTALKHLIPGHPIGRLNLTGQNCLCSCAFPFPDLRYRP